MPADLWKVIIILGDNKGSLPNGHYISFVRPLLPSDFSRFVLYASRIRRLGGDRWEPSLRPLRPYRVSAGVYYALKDYRPSSPLIPNLEYLGWSGMQSRDPEVFRCLHMFYGSKLRTVKLKGPVVQAEEQAHAALRGLARICPQIEELQVNIGLYARFALADVICGLHNLTRLCCEDTAISLQPMMHLAALPALQILSINVSAISDPIQLSSTLDDGPQGKFVALRRLYISAWSVPILTAFLNSIRSSKMIELTTVAQEATSPEVAEEFFTALSLHCSSKQIRLLSFTFNVKQADQADQADQPECALTNRTFLPLLALPRVRKLVIDVNCSLHLDNDFLASMSHAWPFLWKFEFGLVRPWVQRSPQATLAGLVPLAQNCKHLLSIGMALDTRLRRRGFDLERRPGLGVCSASLQDIHVGGSMVEDPAALAAYLSDLFPKLWWIGHSWPSEEDEGEHIQEEWEMAERWREVGRLVKAFVDIRQQERKWAASADAQMATSSPSPGHSPMEE
ncbi:hypothetical protein SCP_0700300 [Sparassis crispa]|uniref:F-box domain-containing protein n=1 Tax=Sparassis crispa TaxID=139825 RepID=A0A401GRS1_9APHY|nr:hypothetical protein SCP_0700300 [Sparassis crispa]GBE84850.1 hypothetical protein SCP_0700300 [Sparassis crispa]